MKLQNKNFQISCDGGAATGKSTGAKMISKKSIFIKKHKLYLQLLRIGVTIALYLHQLRGGTLRIGSGTPPPAPLPRPPEPLQRKTVWGKM